MVEKKLEIVCSAHGKFFLSNSYFLKTVEDKTTSTHLHFHEAFGGHSWKFLVTFRFTFLLFTSTSSIGSSTSYESSSSDISFAAFSVFPFSPPQPIKLMSLCTQKMGLKTAFSSCTSMV
jgi:hypothetical protein